MNLKHYKYTRGLYIVQLEANFQTEIRNKLIEYFRDELVLNEDDLQTELELAMSSRVSDLEDTIDIKKILD